MVEKFPMEEEKIFFLILNLKMLGCITYMKECLQFVIQFRHPPFVEIGPMNGSYLLSYLMELVNKH